MQAEGRTAARPGRRSRSAVQIARGGWLPRTKRGIIHRDLKPENVFVSERRLREAARLRPRTPGRSAATTTPTQTRGPTAHNRSRRRHGHRRLHGAGTSPRRSTRCSTPASSAAVERPVQPDRHAARRARLQLRPESIGAVCHQRVEVAPQNRLDRIHVSDRDQLAARSASTSADDSPVRRAPAAGQGATIRCADDPSAPPDTRSRPRRNVWPRGAPRQANDVGQTARVPARHTPARRDLRPRARTSIAPVRSPAIRCISPSRMSAAMPRRFLALWTRNVTVEVGSNFFTRSRYTVAKSTSPDLRWAYPWRNPRDRRSVRSSAGS